MRLALWMYEGTAHHGVGRITNSMRGVHAVFHAPQGDDYVNPIFSMLDRASSFPQMTTSVVSGRDLAQGTIRLPETLHQVVNKLHPQLIIVCASCSTTLLQEDLQVVADSAKVDTEVLVYDANPYRMQETAAAEGLFTLLVKRYALPQPRTPQPSVNILGPSSLGFHNRSDLIALRRMLATLGIGINVIAPHTAGLDDMARLPAAWLTIAPYRELGQTAARWLEAEHGVLTLLDAPIGVRPTLSWLNRLVEMINVRAKHSPVSIQHSGDIAANASPLLRMPPLTAFSLDGLSAPSGVPWFARTADMESFSGKRAFVFGDATHTVGMVKFLRDELGMQIDGAGTYLADQAEWVAAELADYLEGSGQRSGAGDTATPRHGATEQEQVTGSETRNSPLLVTDRFQEVAARIAELRPDIVCGTQMERHACRKLELECMVIAPPTHIENHLLAYRPFLGFDGADVLADEVYTTTKLGMEQHLIDMFGDAGLDEDDGRKTKDESPVSSQVEGDRIPADGSAALLPSSVFGLSSPTWSADATAMLKKIPFFVRGRVQKKVEQYALDTGCNEISIDVLMTAREQFGG